MTPEQYALAYLEKHGMIPYHNFVPSTAVDKAAKTYTEFMDEAPNLYLKTEPEARAEIMSDLPCPLSGPSRPCTDEDRYDGGWDDRWDG